MTETTIDLQTKCQIWKAKAETWEQAFDKLLVNNCINNKINEDNHKEQELQEQKAINYLENEILSQAEGEVGAKGIWVELFMSWLKQLAIELVGKALEYLVEKGTDWAIDGANFALLKLQDFLYDKYLLANEKQKAIFKTKILEKFPGSGLADKLKNE